MKKFFLAGLIFLVGCSRSVSALDVCHRLEAEGVARNCREDKPGGLASAAVEAAWFDLPSVKGKTGVVYRFDRADAYENTVAAFVAVAMLAGPHRYGSAKAQIFVQMNEGAPLYVGREAKAVVDGL
jgi:hypothetical protein